MSMSFAKRFKELRENLGLTQQEMATRLHKQQPDISKIENGEKELTVSELAEFRNTFHLSNEVILYLTFGIDPGSQTTQLAIRERYEDAEAQRILKYLLEHPNFKSLISRITLLPDKNQQYVAQMLSAIIKTEERR
ncbi:helix-turn-helix transcriptional regulator [Heyndrickxia shackletonii]|uniref:helix-turn-helix transcriptional regulator n=2 Tax=Heyndrickxia TaxID=2837504 RepID=UPI0009F8FAF0|nr:helix-turn-helix transcriptional regulator [Heyndrickxia shackletonii]MBB2479237.1 helix-turn-helix transcriptional regulator [Bacillus sp. APMAM]NEY98979.1 helix-turn-helix transcriptional regulator [Heyndrickxia shackletonii]RTZ57136.1 XRE family transcriptional regulator [Bacillus sp. SAJ1]